MHNVAQKMTDQEVLICLNTVLNAADTVANDVLYHL